MRRRPRRVDGITPFSWMQNTNDVLEQGGVALNRPPGLAAAEGTARHARRARPHPELPPLPLELMLEAIYREPANNGSLHSRTGARPPLAPPGLPRRARARPSPGADGCRARRAARPYAGDANLLSLAHTVEAQSFWRELSEPERTHYVVQAATAAKAYNVKIRKFYARPQTACDDAKIALERWVAKRMSLNARLTMRKIVGAIAEGQSRGCSDR